MIGKRTSRRHFLTGAGGAAAAALIPLPAFAQGAAGRVVVVGGGFAGATCARFIKRIEPRTTVTLVETSQTFTACPFSNVVIAGLRDLSAQQFGYDKVSRRPGHAQILLRDGSRPAGAVDYPRRWLAPAVRPPGAGPGHRYPLGRSARL